jgi:hypothetical protein
MDPQERAALLQEGLISTLPSNEDFGTIKLTSVKPDFILSIHETETGENRKLLTILPNGEVVADDIVTASDAGRVFIESMMMHGKPLLSRIQELEEENELLKQKIKTYEVHQDN